ncbi:MAG: ATP-binding protein [Chitinivibrionales bacterium]|nr:ATP-binding protein [Chitinivibrionales bacterium]
MHRMDFSVQLILDGVPDAMIVTTVNGDITMMNSAAKNLSGIMPNLANCRNIFDVDPMFRAGLPTQASLASGQKSIFDTPNGVPFTNGKGKKRTILIDKGPLLDSEKKNIGYLWIIKEISELVRIRNEMQKIQALESIGILAAGVAHDFNNLLGGLLGFIDLAHRSVENPAECTEHLEGAKDAVQKARDLTAQLLALSKGGIFQKQVASIAKILQNSLRICTVGSPVKTEVFIQEGLWNCNVDQAQISQALNNILINAIQAMPAGGTLAVYAVNVELTEQEIASLSAGKYISISIRDTGCGIPNEIIDHVFDPYFTTKEKGSGLGLAVAWSVIRQHNGHIGVGSAPEQGSVFTLHIPATTAAIENALAEKLFEKSQFNSLRILVMDDDPTIRVVLEKILRKLNCDVTTVVSGELALHSLRKARERHACFDVAILDLTIPGGKGGKDIVAEVNKLFPDIKTIAMSGYTGDPIFENAGAFGFHHALKKPFLIEELAFLLHDAAMRFPGANGRQNGA